MVTRVIINSSEPIKAFRRLPSLLVTILPFIYIISSGKLPTVFLYLSCPWYALWSVTSSSPPYSCAQEMSERQFCSRWKVWSRKKKTHLSPIVSAGEDGWLMACWSCSWWWRRSSRNMVIYWVDMWHNIGFNVGNSSGYT